MSDEVASSLGVGHWEILATLNERTRKSNIPTLALAAAAFSLGTLGAGCSGSSGPHMVRGDVAPLIALADRISREGACAQARDIRALAARRTVLVNEHRIPAPLAEPLSSGVNTLVVQTPPCLPAVPATGSTPAAHGKGHGNDKHGKHGEGD